MDLMQTDGTGWTNSPGQSGVVMGPALFTMMTPAPVGINWQNGLLNRKLNSPTYPLFMKKYEDGI